MPDTFPPEPTGRTPIWLKRLAIYALAAAILAYVLSQIDTSSVTQMLQNMNLQWALYGFLSLHAAQLISALRMQYYARLRRLPLQTGNAIALYYAGMLYNLVLPGGVGGDGYKVWALSRQYDCPMGEGLRVMLGERANGLLLLMLLLFIMIPFSGMWDLLPLPSLFVPLGAGVTLIAYRLGSFRLTGEPLAASVSAGIYSLLAQGLTVFAAYCVLRGMVIDITLYVDYLVMFLIAGVVSIMPITVGGMGVRELVFYTGATEMGLPVEQGIAFSLACFMLYACVAFFGVLALPKTSGKSSQ